jgi:hypothetical protein
MLAAEHEQKNPGTPFSWEKISKDMENILGKIYIHLGKYLRELKKCEMAIESGSDPGHYTLDHKKMDQFNDYINTQIEKDQFLLLSQSALAILTSIIESAASKKNSDDQIINEKTFQIKNIPLYEEGLKELGELKILNIQEDGIILFKPEVIKQHFVYQTILKNFDHSILYSS